MCVQAAGQKDWALPEGHHMQVEGDSELFVGGVHVHIFLKDPHFPLRNPKVNMQAAVWGSSAHDMIPTSCVIITSANTPGMLPSIIAEVPTCTAGNSVAVTVELRRIADSSLDRGLHTARLA